MHNIVAMSHTATVGTVLYLSDSSSRIKNRRAFPANTKFRETPSLRDSLAVCREQHGMNRYSFLAGILPSPCSVADGGGSGQKSSIIFEGCCCFFVKEETGPDEDRKCVYFSPTKQNSDCTQMKICVFEPEDSAHGIPGTCDGQDVWLNLDQILDITVKAPVPARKQPMACLINLPWGLVMNIYSSCEAATQDSQGNIQVLLM
jgi:hypothetical protein